MQVITLPGLLQTVTFIYDAVGTVTMENNATRVPGNSNTRIFQPNNLVRCDRECRAAYYIFAISTIVS